MAGGSSRTGKGVRLTVSVLTDDTCLPAAGMVVDIWHEGPDGQYSGKYRFQGRTGPDGQVTYWTSPVLLSGEGQPHIHIRVRDGDGTDVWTSVPMPGKRAKVLAQVVVHAPSAPLPQV